MGLLGPRHLDDLLRAFGHGVAPAPSAAERHRVLGVWAAVEKPHPMGGGGIFVEAENELGSAPTQARAFITLKHGYLQRKSVGFIGAPTDWAMELGLVDT